MAASMANLAISPPSCTDAARVLKGIQKSEQGEGHEKVAHFSTLLL
jgi:hypothetical protein